jgi:hypothetical protein
MFSTITNHTINVSTAGLLALGAIEPTSAAPVLSNTAVLKSAADSSITDVRWRRYGGWGRGAVAAGVIGGLALGTAAAARSSYCSFCYPYNRYGYSYAPSYYWYSSPYPYGYPYGYGYR